MLTLIVFLVFVLFVILLNIGYTVVLIVCKLPSQLFTSQV
jgi:hypothetical protein